MDFEPQGGADGEGQLTAQATASSRLVAVAVLCCVMGINQSGLFLALAREDVDIQDKVLKFLIQQLVYVDDLHHAVLPQEIQEIQNKTLPSLDLPAMSERCADEGCCPRAASHTAGEGDTQGGADAPMTAPLPADEILATRHLLH